MNTQDIDTADWLDAALKEAGREHRAAYVADNGFTARVIGRLPAAPTLPAWRRPVIILLWLLAGVSVVVSAYGWLVWLLIGHHSHAGLRLGVFSGLIAAAAAVAGRRLRKLPDARARQGP